MAFKKFSQYIEEKNGAFFVLPNDKDFADVIFLYRDADDVMTADVHYLTTATYKGYAHCTGPGCPACNYPTKDGRGIKKEEKLFIPLYNATKGKIEFWDRSTKFMQQVLEPKVFKDYPNPSETVFRVTRNGDSGDKNTRYDVRGISRNSTYTYDKICADFNITFPEAYDQVVKEFSAQEMSNMLNSTNSHELGEYEFTPRPRASVAYDQVPPATDFTVPTPTYNAVPEQAPGIVPSVPGVELPEANITPMSPMAPVAEDFPEPIGDELATDPIDDVSF